MTFPSSPYFKLSNYTASNIYYWLKAKLTFVTKKRAIEIANRAIECRPCWENGDCLACGCDTFGIFKSGKPCDVPKDIGRQFTEYENKMFQKYWKCVHEQPYDIEYCMEEHELREYNRLKYLSEK